MYPIENARSNTFTYGTVVSSKLIDIEYDDAGNFVSADHAHLVYKGSESEVVIDGKERHACLTGTWDECCEYFDTEL